MKFVESTYQRAENKEAEKKNKNEEHNEEEKTEDNEEKSIEERLKELRIKSAVTRPQMEIIARFRDENEGFNINTDFLGLDLTEIPINSIKSFNIKDKSTYIVLTNLIIPVLYMGISILNIIQTSKKAGQKTIEKENSNVIVLKAESTNEEKSESLIKSEDEKLNAEDISDAMKDANKSMLYFMPLIMFTVTMNAPLSLALYWLTNTVLSFIEKLAIDKLINKEEAKEIDIDIKKAKKVKK